MTLPDPLAGGTQTTVNYREQAISRFEPQSGILSDMAILRQLAVATSSFGVPTVTLDRSGIRTGRLRIVQLLGTKR